MLAKRTAKDERFSVALVVVCMPEVDVSAGHPFRAKTLPFHVRLTHFGNRYELLSDTRFGGFFHHRIVIFDFLIDFSFAPCVFNDFVPRSAATDERERQNGDAENKQNGLDQA